MSGHTEQNREPALGKFCHACQAIPQMGYCRLAGCPSAPATVAAKALMSKPLFSRRLALARNDLEMSQEELSRRSGLPASVISHYESGRRSPSLDNLVRIVRAMPGVNANWLMGLTSNPTSDNYEDGYADAIRDAQEALLGLYNRSNATKASPAEDASGTNPQ